MFKIKADQQTKKKKLKQKTFIHPPVKQDKIQTSTFIDPPVKQDKI